MTLFRYSFMINVLIVIIISYCTGFHIVRVEYDNERKRQYAENIVQPVLEDCAWEWERWGVTSDHMRRYSRLPRLYPHYDNDVFDCAWGCFFLHMGWLDDDMEGSFQAPVILAHLENYLEDWRHPRSRRMSSRCIYVNYPHAELTGNVPDCEQAKILKNCLIKEEYLEITLVELLRSWLGVCADLEGLPVAEVLARAARPPAPSPPPGDPAPPALHGCAWRCLFYDMGVMNDVDGVFVLPVVNETIRMYYYKTELIPLLMEESAKCVAAANRFIENPDVDTRPHGCDRSQLYVDCLVNNFFTNLTSPWFTDEERSIRVGNQSTSPSPPRGRHRRRPHHARGRAPPPPPGARPPPRERPLGRPHLVRTRFLARVAPLPLSPSDSVVVKVKVAETDT
ncbi:uncharacterized protein LOC133530746 isoform X2 [Cydia pomonella]|uniref:uncharacterized protein LOC133530746 isoform X2 n=1 Tax=Cydia pomonella TaxID=82600 RepID=UPI002ADDD43C|nr:uncharacterized protein LOC133530746 isoform X2 [Cydia pomonella]